MFSHNNVLSESDNNNNNRRKFTEQARRRRRLITVILVTSISVVGFFALSIVISAFVTITSLPTHHVNVSQMFDGPQQQPWQIFQGRWRLNRGENMDLYIYQLGMPWMLAKIAASVTFDLNIRVNGSVVKMQVETPLTTEPEYDHNVDGPETRIIVQGHEYLASTTWEQSGGKLVVKTVSASGDTTIKPHNTIRQIVNGQLTTTMQIGDLEAKQYFDRVN